MKILLDECVDARLARHFSEFDVETVHDRGWSGITNGKLLALAQVEFDVFVTVDRNLTFQQNIPKFSLAVILVHCVSNRLAANQTLHRAPDASVTQLAETTHAPSAGAGELGRLAAQLSSMFRALSGGTAVRPNPPIKHP